MTTDQRIENLEKGLASARRFNRWLLAAVGLALALALGFCDLAYKQSSKGTSLFYEPIDELDHKPMPQSDIIGQSINTILNVPWAAFFELPAGIVAAVLNSTGLDAAKDVASRLEHGKARVAIELGLERPGVPEQLVRTLGTGFALMVLLMARRRNAGAADRTGAVQPESNPHH